MSGNNSIPGNNGYKPSDPYYQYEVPEGLSLKDVGEIFGKSVEELAQFNNLEDPNLIQIGQPINIPISENDSENYISYEIEPGETFSEISDEFDISEEELQYLNGDIKDIHSIQAGDTMRIHLTNDNPIDPDNMTSSTDSKEDPQTGIVTTYYNADAAYDMIFDNLLENGTLKEKNGNFIYTTDGEMTAQEISELLHLDKGDLYKSNEYGAFSDYRDLETVNGVVFPEGTELKILDSDLPSKEVTDFKDKNGETIDGFFESRSGQLYYTVQYEDNYTDIKKMLEGDAFKDYKVKDTMKGLEDYKGVPIEPVIEGTVIPVYEKGWLGKLLS